MMRFAEGNLLESGAEALVNTVNTVGVMGKGVALMFKEAFPENYRAYRAACQRHEVRVGHMLVVERERIGGPKWIINFPTKEHWRSPSRIEWIESGLRDLVQVISAKRIHSIAIPPLGAGNGGLNWDDVRPRIEKALSCLPDVDVIVYEPTAKYQNVAKRKGVEKLTVARALIAELVRRYWIEGMECSLIEIQKLAWFLERAIDLLGLDNPLDLKFEADKYGPYANRLTHLLDGLDGSYLHCEKRITDASPFDAIWFDNEKAKIVQVFLTSPEAKPYTEALARTSAMIEGFESPFGLELLSTVDWLATRERVPLSLDAIRDALAHWKGGQEVASRKLRMFDDRVLKISIDRLMHSPLELRFSPGT